MPEYTPRQLMILAAVAEYELNGETPKLERIINAVVADIVFETTVEVFNEMVNKAGDC